MTLPGQHCPATPIDEYRIIGILMKIPPTTSPVTGGSAAEAGEHGRAKVTTGKTAATATTGDTVQLSSLSTQLHALASTRAEPEFDRAKVDQIKQAIRDGKFVVKPEVVADRLIDDVRGRIARGAR
jgi:negative regulator of flagellin synthesis FlgM